MRKKGLLFCILITVHFFLPRLMRSDPFVFLSSDGTEVTAYGEEEIRKYKAYYGLDRPLWQQYVHYLAGLITGDLGYSIYFKDKVTRLIFRHLVWTFGIVSVSLCISLAAGLMLGSLSAWHFGKRCDTMLYRGMTILAEIPSFLTANVILMVFIIRWRILPTSGGISPFLPLRFSAAVIFDIIKHGILPCGTLSLMRIPEFYFICRAAMLRQLQKKYTETAKAKSLGSMCIMRKHCLPNAANPIITRFLLSIQTMFNGALIVENVFRYPGIGKLIRDAVFYRDYLLLQGIFFVITVFILCVSALGEYLYRTADKGESV